MQTVLESGIQTAAYILETRFIPYKDFELVPVSAEYTLTAVLAANRMAAVFDKSQTVRAGDKRAYAFVLRRKKEVTPEDLLQSYKLGGTELGRLQVTWVGNFGEKNSFFSRSISVAQYTTGEFFTVRMVNPPEKLFVEEPHAIALRLTNTTPNVFRLKLYVKEDESKTLGINALSHQARSTNVTIVGAKQDPAVPELRHSGSSAPEVYGDTETSRTARDRPGGEGRH